MFARNGALARNILTFEREIDLSHQASQHNDAKSSSCVERLHMCPQNRVLASVFAQLCSRSRSGPGEERIGNQDFGWGAFS